MFEEAFWVPLVFHPIFFHDSISTDGLVQFTFQPFYLVWFSLFLNAFNQSVSDRLFLKATSTYKVLFNETYSAGRSYIASVSLQFAEKPTLKYDVRDAFFLDSTLYAVAMAASG